MLAGGMWINRVTGRGENTPSPLPSVRHSSEGGFAVAQMDASCAAVKLVIRHAQNGTEDQVADKTRQGLTHGGNVPIQPLVPFTLRSPTRFLRGSRNAA